MRSLLPGLLAALAPGCAGLGLAMALERDWLPDLIFTGSYQVDLAALVSTAGLLISALIMGVVLIIRRSDRQARRAQEEEHLAQEEAHRRFLRRLDHEMKNPLTIIRLGVVNLQHSPNLSSEGTATVARVAQQARRLQRLIEDLRWFTELEARGLERQRIELQEVLEEAVEIVRSVGGRGGREIVLNLQKVPWPLAAVEADRDLLIIAFRNLIDNAMKYTAPGDQVEVRATDDGNMALIEVADTGPGIPDDELPHIFEELYRGRQSERVPGSGLGLTLVQRIVELHGGEIAVRSRVGQGTVMTVRLPIAPSGS